MKKLILAAVIVTLAAPAMAGRIISTPVDMPCRTYEYQELKDMSDAELDAAKLETMNKDLKNMEYANSMRLYSGREAEREVQTADRNSDKCTEIARKIHDIQKRRETEKAEKAEKAVLPVANK